MNLVLLGPPGTGKGTISEFIQQRFGFKHVSTGDLLREEVRKKTTIGEKIAPIMNEGKLVDDSIVLEILEKKLVDEQGSFILDGFPRNLNQGKLLDRLMNRLGKKLDFALEVDSDAKIIVKRLSARRQCIKCRRIYGLDVPSRKKGVCDDCGGKTVLRDDDKASVVKKRLRIYNKITKPLSDYYEAKGLLEKVDGNQTLQEIFSEVEGMLAKHAEAP